MLLEIRFDNQAWYSFQCDANGFIDTSSHSQIVVSFQSFKQWITQYATKEVEMLLDHVSFRCYGSTSLLCILDSLVFEQKEQPRFVFTEYENTTIDLDPLTWEVWANGKYTNQQRSWNHQGFMTHVAQALAKVEDLPKQRLCYQITRNNKCVCVYGQDNVIAKIDEIDALLNK